MLGSEAFVGCITDNLKKRNFKQARIDEIIEEYNRAARLNEASGMDRNTAAMKAMKDTFDRMSTDAQNRAKRNAAMLAVQADNIDRIRSGVDAAVSGMVFDGKKASKGLAVARAAVSLIEDDPRFSGLSYMTNKETTRGLLWSHFAGVLDTIGKGFMARQKGKAHLPNVVREVFGEDTGDRAAKEVAEAYLQTDKVAVRQFNNAGGVLSGPERYFPQPQNAAKLMNRKDEWIDMHMRIVDWNRTRWPDGTAIPADRRRGVLEKVYETLSTDGANKIDISAFRGRGRAIGNQVDRHRFIHYQSADAWLEAHNAFGDGSVFDTIVQHIETMAHKIATVQTFGPNPEMTALNIASIVRNTASQFTPKDVADADGILKNKFDPMFEVIMRQNPMDPHSFTGGLVTGVGNILTSAQLGSAALLAIPGDFMQTAAVRALNRMGLFDGIGTYFKTIATDRRFQREIAAQTGFIHDEVVMATYAQERFTGVATVGPAVTRRVSEAVMRASLLAPHTSSARWAAQSEFMGLMHRMRNTAFEDLPFVHVARRYGINAEMWDAFRGSVGTFSPRNGVEFMRPLDVMKSDLPNRDELYRRFQGMIVEEARKMVPESTVEGATMLRGSTRPDTLIGSILYSFAMYKNFPVSFQMIYGRLGLTLPTKRGRLAFYAGLGAGMTMVGALGTQMREISKGRDPLPMDTPEFLGKAMLSGGGMSIWGDFLFSGINEYGRGPGELIAGPLYGFFGDATQLAFGDAFAFVDHVGGLDAKGGPYESDTLNRAVAFAKRYTPGTSVWWARLGLEREVFDQLALLTDPKAARRWRAWERTQLRERGNRYWWRPGDTEPARAPQFGR